MEVMELLDRGIRTQDNGCFLRSAGVIPDAACFDLLLDYAKPGDDVDYMWVVGSRVYDSDVLKNNPHFQALRPGAGDGIGSFNNNSYKGKNLLCLDRDAHGRWNDDTVILILFHPSLKKVLNYVGVRVDLTSTKKAKDASLQKSTDPDLTKKKWILDFMSVNFPGSLVTADRALLDERYTLLLKEAEIIYDRIMSP